MLQKGSSKGTLLTGQGSDHTGQGSPSHPEETGPTCSSKLIGFSMCLEFHFVKDVGDKGTQEEV